MTVSTTKSLMAATMAAALAFGWTARPVRADLSIRGGSQNQRLLLEKVYSHDLPSRFATLDKIPVELIGDREMDRIAQEDRDVSSPSGTVSETNRSGPDDRDGERRGIDRAEGDSTNGDPSDGAKGGGDREYEGAGQNDDDEYLLGVYDSDTRLISLRESVSDDDLVTTFAHEYGHYVWETLLTRSDRRRYRKLYAVQQSAHQLVDWYAATEDAEGFAESFMFYVERPSRLVRRDSASYQFIDQLKKEPVPAGRTIRSTRSASPYDDPEHPGHRRQG